MRRGWRCRDAVIIFVNEAILRWRMDGGCKAHPACHFTHSDFYLRCHLTISKLNMFYAGWKLWNFCSGSSTQREQKEVQDVQVRDQEESQGWGEDSLGWKVRKQRPFWSGKSSGSAKAVPEDGRLVIGRIWYYQNVSGSEDVPLKTKRLLTVFFFFSWIILQCRQSGSFSILPSNFLPFLTSASSFLTTW